MSFVTKIENMQVAFFNKIGFLRRLQFVRPSNKDISVVVRKSFADLGPISKQSLEKVYHVPKSTILADRSRMFVPVTLFFWTGMCLTMIVNYSATLSELDSDSDLRSMVSETNRFIFQLLRVCLFPLWIVPSLYLLMKPSRSVQAIYLTKIGSRPYMVAQCGRVFGSVPTYYIFDGREEQRAITCLNAEANRKLEMARMTGNKEKIREMGKSLDDQMRNRNRSEQSKINTKPIKFNNGYLTYSNNLSLCGDFPRTPPAALFLHAMHGEVKAKKSTLQKYNGFPLAEALLREVYQQKKKSNTAGKEAPTEFQKTILHYSGNLVAVLLILISYQLLFGLPFIGDTKILQTIFDNFRQTEDQNRLAELEKQVAQLESDTKSEVVNQRKRAVDDLQ